jgi:beta-lactamase class D
MILPKVGKLVAFHPMGATKTLFGYFLKEENANYKLSYLASADTVQGNQAWVIGYIEENMHPYFFVLHTFATESKDLQNRNINLLKSILQKEGFFKGVR